MKITIDRSLVEQALEALKAGPDVDPIFAGQTEDALRAALAEPVEPDPWGAGYEAGYAAGCARRPAQPVQEPVQDADLWSAGYQAGYAAGMEESPAEPQEPTRENTLAAAGFKPRDRRLPCDDCGRKFTVQMLPIHKCDAGMAERPAQPQEPDNGGKTGWPPGLLQDDCRGLSKWLASRPDARRRLREALAEPVQLREHCLWARNGNEPCPHVQQAQPVQDTDCHAQGICQRTGYSIGQRKPLSVTDLQDALVYTCLIDRDAIEDPEGYDTGSTLAQINALHEILTRKPT